MVKFNKGYCEVCMCYLDDFSRHDHNPDRCIRCVTPAKVSAQFNVGYSTVACPSSDSYIPHKRFNVTTLPSSSILASMDELHNNRQANKKFMGPPELMEIFGYQLQIGAEKGYKNGSWEQYIENGTSTIPSISRHLIGVSKGKDNGFYTEYKPNGEPCPTKANHAYALFWNAAIEALKVYRKSKSNG